MISNLLEIIAIYLSLLNIFYVGIVLSIDGMSSWLIISSMSIVAISIILVFAGGLVRGKHSQKTSSTTTAQNNTAFTNMDKLGVKPTAQLPKGFKEGKCKCGNSYGYCGVDIGYCVKCIDAMETQSD